MESLYSVLFAIGQNTLIAFFFALMIAVSRYRRINSTVLCIGLVFTFQSLMLLLRDPLLALNSREVWYGTWTLIDVLVVCSIYKSHQALKVNLARVSNAVALTYVVSAFIHTLRYIEREHFGGEYLDSWYYIAVNTINISLAIYVLGTVLRDKKEKLVGLYV